ncbi:hypothetical protein IWQ62_002512 [Dispira parvispora]|uniref:Importin N-terminal domain-containing protein n=1 Tax=Dispira parvispora TaxID=1520584 RepID=A0A9W8ASM3_9FUNG|nr:hypothetical protein IWQ62_002512 [Dispira parvispora]
MDVEVYEAIRKACTGDKQLLLLATRQLEHLQTQAGFFRSLFKIAAQAESDVHRIQALFFFNNRMKSFWRISNEAGPYLSPEDKQEIFKVLWENLYRGTVPSAVENFWYCTYARACTLEYIANGASILSRVVELINNPNHIGVVNGSVTPTQESRKCRMFKFLGIFIGHLYQEITDEKKDHLTSDLWNIGRILASRYTELQHHVVLQPNDDQLEIVTMSLVSILQGANDPDLRNSTIVKLLADAIHNFSKLFAWFKEKIKDPTQTAQYLNYFQLCSQLHILLVTRNYDRIFEYDNTQALLDTYSQLLLICGARVENCYNPADESQLPKRLVVNSLVVCRLLLARYIDAEKNGSKILGVGSRYTAPSHNPTPGQLVQVLVTYLLGVQPVDVLHYWKQEPIEWFHRHWNNDNNASISHHALELFSLLLEHYPEKVIPLLNECKELASGFEPSETVLRRMDGLYVALAIKHPRLAPLTLSTFFRPLFPFLKRPWPFIEIMEYRAAWVLVKQELATISDPVHCQIYNLLDHLLTPTKPLVVRLAATEALRRWLFGQFPQNSRVSAWRTSVQDNLWVLLQETFHCPKSRVLVMGAIEKMTQCAGISEDQVTKLLHHLGERDELNEASFMVFLRTVPVISAFVNAPRLNVGLIAESLCNLVVCCVESEKEDVVRVGVDLWQTLIFYKNDVGPYAGSLVTLLLEKVAAEEDTETRYIDLLIYYLLMDLEVIVQCRKVDFFRVLLDRIKRGSHAAMTSTCRVIEAMICSDVARFTPLARIMSESSCFGYLVNTFIHARNDYQARDAILLVLARLTLHRTDEFVQALHGLGTEDNPSEAAVRLIECWLFAYPKITQPKLLKLSVLALGELIRAEIEDCDHYIPSMVKIWTKFLYTTLEDASGNSPRYWTNSNSITDKDALKNCKPTGDFPFRVQLIGLHDPAYTIHTGRAIADLLERIIQVFPGGDAVLERTLANSPHGCSLKTLYTAILGSSGMN